MSKLALIGRLRDALTATSVNAVLANEANINAAASNEANINTVAENLTELQNSSAILTGLNKSPQFVRMSNIFTGNSFGTGFDFEEVNILARNVVLVGVSNPLDILYGANIDGNFDMISADLNGGRRSNNDGFSHVYLAYNQAADTSTVYITGQQYTRKGMAGDIVDQMPPNITHFAFLGVFHPEYPTSLVDRTLYLGEGSPNSLVSQATVSGANQALVDTAGGFVSGSNPVPLRGVYNAQISVIKASGGDTTGTAGNISITVDGYNIFAASSLNRVRFVEDQSFNIPYVTRNTSPLIGGEIFSSSGDGIYRILNKAISIDLDEIGYFER